MSDDRILFHAWLVLVGLTVLSVGVNLAGGSWEGSGRAATCIAMAASLFKARQVLDHYLGLRHSKGAWRGLFTAALVIILGGVVVVGLV